MPTQNHAQRTLIRWRPLLADANGPVQTLVLSGALSDAQWRAMLAYSLPVSSGVFETAPLVISPLHLLGAAKGEAPLPFGRLDSFAVVDRDAAKGASLWGTTGRWLQRWFHTQGPMLDPRYIQCQRATWLCECISDAVRFALHQGRQVSDDVLPEVWDAAHEALGRRLAGVLPQRVVELPDELLRQLEALDRVACGR